MEFNRLAWIVHVKTPKKQENKTKTIKMMEKGVVRAKKRKKRDKLVTPRRYSFNQVDEHHSTLRLNLKVRCALPEYRSRIFARDGI